MKRVFLICIITALAMLAMAQTTAVDLPTRLAQLETATFGGPNVAGTATPLFVKLAGSGAQTISGGNLINASGFVGPRQDSINQVVSVDGAVTPLAGLVVITKATALAGTIAAPTATTDDGKILRIVSTTAAAHVITSGVDGFNNKGSSGTCTFGAAKGNSVTLLAYQGHWFVIASTGNTVA